MRASDMDLLYDGVRTARCIEMGRVGISVFPQYGVKTTLEARQKDV